jgi:hypothetical protein
MQKKIYHSVVGNDFPMKKQANKEKGVLCRTPFSPKLLTNY